MSLRARISHDLAEAMTARDPLRLSTLRLICAAIRDRDLALRAEAADREMSDPEILSTLARMAKMRRDSLRAYEEGGRLELAEQEQAEIAVIETYLPRRLDVDETAVAIDAVIADLDARSIRDIGRVMSALKDRHDGQMDFAGVGAQVRARLSARRPDGQD